MEKQLNSIRQLILKNKAITVVLTLLVWLISIAFFCVMFHFYVYPFLLLSSPVTTVPLMTSILLLIALSVLKIYKNKPSLQETAIYVDRVLNKDDQISTAFEYGKESSIPKIDMQHSYPTKTHLYACSALIILSCMTPLWNKNTIDESRIKEDLPIVQEMRKSANKMANKAAKMKDVKLFQQSANKIRQLSKELNSGKVEKKKILIDASTLRKTMRAALQSFDTPKKHLDELKANSKGELKKALNKNGEGLAALAKKVQNNSLTSQEKQAIENSLKDMLDKAKASNNKKSQELEEAIQKALDALKENKGDDFAQAMKNLMKQANSSDQGLSQEQQELMQLATQAMNLLQNIPSALGEGLDAATMEELNSALNNMQNMDPIDKELMQRLSEALSKIDPETLKKLFQQGSQAAKATEFMTEKEMKELLEFLESLSKEDLERMLNGPP